MEATPRTPKPSNPQSARPSPLAASSSSSSSSSFRLWRPSAQRNVRNQWSKLASLRRDWSTASSNGRAIATYMPSMELGVLSDIPDIKNKATQKLYWQKELYRSKLLSTYKDMVSVVTNIVKTSGSMRCFLKGTSSSPLLQFSGYSEYNDDPGNGGGIPVFTFWSISSFEKMADELAQMLILELNLKRLIVVNLLSIGCKLPTVNHLHWSEEMYPGEFGDLNVCNLLSGCTCKPIYPKLYGGKSDKPVVQCTQQPDHDVLQVYLTTWITEGG